ncbi:S41 family peptidase [Panacibacter ginsenosidivorans]|nr:S41 family peptidase [Panacibacter ginsenosidivorans]
MNGMRRKGRCHKNQLPVTKKTISLLYFTGILLLLSSCATSKHSTYNPAAKIPAAKLQEDFSLLKKILEANHPSLYWYTPKDSVDIYFNEVMQSINDSLTEIQFKNKVAWFISKIKCGHTSVRPSIAYSDYAIAHKQPRFPLLIKTWNDSLIFLGSLNKQDTLFKRGTVITSIENYDNRTLLDSLFRFISTDGHGDNFKSQAVSFNFPLYYSFAFPLKDSFFVRYIDSGIEKQTYVQLNKPFIDISKSKKTPAAVTPPKPSRKQIKQIMLVSKRSMIFDSVNNLAYMRLATFSGGNLRRFFRQSFKELHENKLSNLVIDLRENSGGNINMSTLLTRYIKNKTFHTADTAAAISRSFSYSRYIQPSFPYRMAMRFTTAKKKDGKFHFKQLEQHNCKPVKNIHYDGNVFIIQGGYTFSAAAMFVLQLKGQQNVTVTGEETGGGDYGTSAVYLPDIVLPNSKVRVVLPLYRLVFNSNKIKNGQGIAPDMYIPPSSVDISKGIDPKLQRVKELIQEKNKKGL